MPPSTSERHEAILARVLAQGHVKVRDLAESMKVSEATVRRDLRTLSAAGELELTHGGATSAAEGESSFRARSRRQVEAKGIVGRLAADLVGEAETVFLDSGTTIFAMIPHLRTRRALTVITHSARFALEFGGAPNVRVVTLGGQYRPDRMDSIGPMTLEALDKLRGFRAFIGSDGLSPDFGVTACDMESAHLYQLAIENARETILLVDHSKFEAPSLYRIADLASIHRVVTDRLPDEAWQAALRQHEIELICPETAESTEGAAAATNTHFPTHRSN